MRTAIITIVIIAVFLEVSGLIWSGKDGEPGDAYRRLSQPPDRLINDPRSNGYFMMIGFAASADSDPVRTGLDIWQEAETDGNRRLFNYRKSGRTQLRTTLDADEAFPAWLSTSPLAEFRKHDAFLRLSMDRYSILLDRYERFVEMPFDDRGFGHRDVPRLDEFLIVHRLYIASGYAQSPQLGWVRVQRDLRAWRRVLAEARTLAVKTAALVILEDTLAFLANVPAGDRMSAMTSLLAVTQPFTKDDYSLRWPIRNEFVLGTSQGRATTLDLMTGVDETVRNEEWLARKARLAPHAFRRVRHPPLTTMFEARVDSSRMWDTYAMYYDLAIMASETVHTPLPRLREVARTSPRTLAETLLSPVEFEPDWDPFSLRLMETDAKLRLASLQLMLHHSGFSAAAANRLAEVGPRYYDPFTGLPMLWSETQRVVYSVGRDRIDDGGDPHFDLVVPITFDPPKPRASRAVRAEKTLSRAGAL